MVVIEKDSFVGDTESIIPSGRYYTKAVTISFHISCDEFLADTSCEAERGMTWRQWVASQYHEEWDGSSFYIEDDKVMSRYGPISGVTPDDVISSGYYDV